MSKPYTKDELRYSDPEKRRAYKKNHSKTYGKDYRKKHPENNKNYDKIRNGIRLKKVEVVRLLGGKCCICGYHKNLAALELHHPDGTTKSESFTYYRKLSLERIIKEILPFVILVCSNCHREIHNPDFNINNN
jgi:hypothetical protein